MRIDFLLAYDDGISSLEWFLRLFLVCFSPTTLENLIKEENASSFGLGV
jgi:hypothetical protein